MNWLIRLPWTPLLLAAVLLGLAPFVPEPHLWEKLKMLAAGELVRPIDIFDLLMHGAPVALLAGKAILMAKRPSSAKANESANERE